MNRRVRERCTIQSAGHALALAVVAALLAAIFAPFSPAAAPPVTGSQRVPAKQPEPEGVLQFNPEMRVQVAASTLFLNNQQAMVGGPALGKALQAIATLRAGVVFECWTVLDTNKFQKFDVLLTSIRDGGPIEDLEKTAYFNALIRAHYNSLQAFAGAADPGLTFEELFATPAVYRGKVLRVAGRLRRIERVPAPASAQEQGVYHVYRASLADVAGVHSCRVDFTTWPAGLSRDLLGKDLDQRIYVGLDGFLFKKFNYHANAPLVPKKDGDRAALLFVGHSLVVLKSAPATRFRYQVRSQMGAATLFLNATQPAVGPSGLGRGLQQVGTLQAGEAFDCWKLVDTDRFRPLDKKVLASAEIKDGTGIAIGNLEAEGYVHVLVQAHNTSLKAFEGAADRSLSYAHLFNSPAAYRGQVARAQGRLRRINRFEPPPEALAQGIHDLYEAWIINDDYGANPYCVVFTNWPVGLPRELLGKSTIDHKVFVTFDGYFFKKFRYKAVDSKEKTRREAPMLIGNSLLVGGVIPPARAKETPWLAQFLYVFMGLLGGVVVFVAALALWLRRNDRRTQRRIQATRNTEFVLPTPDALPVAPPVGHDVLRLATSPGNNGGPRTQTAEASAATRWGDRAGERGASSASGGAATGETGPGNKGGSGPGPDPGEDAGA